MTASAHILRPNSVTRVMLLVLACLLPGVFTYAWQFGWGILINLVWASLLALAIETIALKLRAFPVKPFLLDGSAIVTAWLLALSLPPLAPWWLMLVGMIFAIGVAKHLYGGLGQNIFNPAMVGFAVLIISFPVQMTQWSAPLELATQSLSLSDSFSAIFGGTQLDAVVMATPLDSVRTGLLQQHTLEEIRAPSHIFGSIGGVGGEWIAAAWLVGGIALWALRIIPWQVPVAFLVGVWLTAGFLHWADVERYAAPWFMLAMPSTMLGAFFIATDPVSGATTPKGRIIFGLGAGFLAVVIRVFGGYPDGVAFAILLMNLCAPLIDVWTQPRVFGEAKKS
jgi:electron transport complex protein RnfD